MTKEEAFLPAPVHIPPRAYPGAPHVEHVRAVTSRPEHHFFGYYGISPWDASQRFMACLECSFGDRLVAKEDVAQVCLIEMPEAKLTRIAQTRAWNLQQGAMLHWLDPARPHNLVFNQRTEAGLGAVVMDVTTREQRTLDRPVAAMSPDRKTAASLNYARLRALRPVVGYAGIEDATVTEAAPKDDGLFLLDLETGESKLILTIREVFDAVPLPEDYEGQPMWFNHAVFSRDGRRIFFLARYNRPGSGLVNAAMTVGVDGSGLHCLLDYAWRTSHFDWIDDTRLVLTVRGPGDTRWYHFILTDGEEGHTALATDKLDHDGHCAVSPDMKWIVTDSYPTGEHRMQHLFLVHLESQEVFSLAAFHTPEIYKRDWRCDLHPRWSPDGRQLSIDSTHTGIRQLYVLDVVI